MTIYIHFSSHLALSLCFDIASFIKILTMQWALKLGKIVFQLNSTTHNWSRQQNPFQIMVHLFILNGVPDQKEDRKKLACHCSHTCMYFRCMAWFKSGSWVSLSGDFYGTFHERFGEFLVILQSGLWVPIWLGKRRSLLDDGLLIAEGNPTSSNVVPKEICHETLE